MSIKAGVGTKFRRWKSASSAWEDIANVVSIDGPGMSRETIDSTTLDVTDGYRTFIASLRDAGSISLTIQFTRAVYEQMKTDFESDDEQFYEILLPDAENTSLEFEGLVTELPLSIEVDAIITTEITIKITGKVEMDSGSGS